MNNTMVLEIFKVLDTMFFDMRKKWNIQRPIRGNVIPMCSDSDIIWEGLLCRVRVQWHDDKMLSPAIVQFKSYYSQPGAVNIIITLTSYN